LSVKIDEELYLEHKKHTEQVVKKLVIFLAGMFLFILISYFFI
jgi:hypothetical protein